MRILGIDPGYATIGFGLITAERAQVNMLTYGAITTPAGLPLSRRLYQIGTDMEDLIGQLKPDVISIEELFFNTNLTTGIAVAHARGVLLYTAEKCGIPLHEYTPSQVKMAVVGYGKAEKRQVMDMTRRLLHLKAVPRPDDAADALALALCHARSATSRLPLQGQGDHLNSQGPDRSAGRRNSELPRKCDYPCFTIWTAPWQRFCPIWRSSTAAAWATPARPPTPPWPS